MTFPVAYRNRGGKLINLELAVQDMVMREGHPVSVQLIDLTFALTLRHGLRTVMSSPALISTHEQACVVASAKPPPDDFRGVSLTLVYNSEFWVLLIEEWGGPGIDR